MSTYTIYDAHDNALGDVKSSYLPTRALFWASSHLTDEAITQLGIDGDALVSAECHTFKQS